MKIDKQLQMRGECLIQCAKDEEGKPKGNPKINIDAYNGGIMNVSGYGPVVVDIQGMRVKDVTPIIYDHNRNSVDAILGQTSKVEKGNTLKASGEIMGDSDTCTRVLTLGSRGYRFQASIGATPYKATEVEAGATAEANGQTHQGPFLLVTESELDEITVVPLGADKTTNAAIVAAKPKKGEETMSTENTKDMEAIRAAAVAEESRIAGIKAAAKDHDTIRASAINEGWTVEKTETTIKDALLAAATKELADIKAKAKADEDAKGRPAAPAIKGSNTDKVDGRVIEAAACMNAGLKSIEKAYDSETLNKASDLKVRSLTDVVRAAMAAEGKRLDASRHETREFLQAAFSTRSIANVLSNVANKFIREGFGTVEETWKMISGVRSVVDFKANTGIRLVMANLLKELAPNGEIQHGSLSDETRSIQADTKALMLGITRKDIINDDLSALTELPRRLGFAAARTFNVDFWAAWTAALAAQFPTNNSKGNYQNLALSLANLATVEQAFLQLKDSDGNPVGADASVLLVAPGNSVLSREIFTSTNLVSGNTTKSTAGNPFAGMYTPAVTRYLSGNGWALLANPQAVPVMEAAFLNGQQEPIVETADADFNTLGVQMRCYYDYGVAAAEDKAGVYSAGG